MPATNSFRIGAEQILRARADGGDEVAAWQLIELLAKRGLYYAMWRQQVGEGKERIAAPV